MAVLNRRCQPALDGVIDELMHGAGVAKAHFGFGRVDIDVNQRRVDVDKQADRRLASAMQHVAIRFAQGVADDFVAHEPAIDEHLLTILGFAGAGWVDDETLERNWPGSGVDRKSRTDEFVPQDIGDASL